MNTLDSHGLRFFMHVLFCATLFLAFAVTVIYFLLRNSGRPKFKLEDWLVIFGPTPIFGLSLIPGYWGVRLCFVAMLAFMAIIYLGGQARRRWMPALTLGLLLALGALVGLALTVANNPTAPPTDIIGLGLATLMPLAVVVLFAWTFIHRKKARSDAS